LPHEAVVNRIREETGFEASVVDASEYAYDIFDNVNTGGTTVRTVRRMPQPYWVLLEEIVDHYHYDLQFICKLGKKIGKGRHKTKWFDIKKIDFLETPNNIKRAAKDLLEYKTIKSMDSAAGDKAQLYLINKAGLARSSYPIQILVMLNRYRKVFPQGLRYKQLYERIKKMSGVKVSHNTVYVALNNHIKDGLVEKYLEHDRQKPVSTKEYYKITGSGAKYLNELNFVLDSDDF
jgi:hypothetical protein